MALDAGVSVDAIPNDARGGIVIEHRGLGEPWTVTCPAIDGPWAFFTREDAIAIGHSLSDRFGGDLFLRDDEGTLRAFGGGGHPIATQGLGRPGATDAP